MTTESLTKALHSATCASRELQDALKTADAVEALVLLPMIADAARLAQQISGLMHAMSEFNATAATEAIAESVQRNTIARVVSTPATRVYLLAMCDESVETENELEFTGTDDAGNAWRVHCASRGAWLA